MKHMRPLVGLLATLSAVPLLLEDRRRALVEALGTMLDSEAHFWAWGRGHPKDGPPPPMGIIHCGFTPERMTTYIEMAMFPETNPLIRNPMIPLFPHAIAARQRFITLEKWHASEVYSNYFMRMGLDEWLCAVHYCSDDTWAQLYFAKATGAPPFSDEDVNLVDIVLDEVHWLYPDALEAIPKEVYDGLSQRHRTVLPMLVEGHSRKRIAELLCISESTLNDHVKAIYRHFNVHSIAELSAKFLRQSSH